MSSKSASKSSAKAAKSNSSRTIMGVVSAVVIVGAVAYLAYSMGWIGAGEETQASKAVMPPEVQAEWDKVHQDTVKAAEKINRPPSGS
jgi:cell division protein FtsN